MGSSTEDLRGGNDVDFGDSVAAAALSLARHFAAGATLWCIAPESPEHARHVAVEFVHPVLVGKRALPAVSVDALEPVGALRSLVQSGDVVLAVGRRESPSIVDTMRRAEAWGAATIWLGCGERPGLRAADHVVWTDDDQPDLAAHDGRLVLLYHVLWELTHVCLEHRGLLQPTVATECDGEMCITCSDEGRLGEVVSTNGIGRTRARTAKGVEEVDTTIVDVVPGDLVLIHAGAAIAVVP